MPSRASCAAAIRLPFVVPTTWLYRFTVAYAGSQPPGRIFGSDAVGSGTATDRVGFGDGDGDGDGVGLGSGSGLGEGEGEGVGEGEG
ncbi:hypothetical protein, partial [Kitasatospora nipponensis]|uniref:hypothetical protein n=1 Tax=Kitasatospora nipponensis TaxID=258049 RepID=UPI0031DDE51B